ncbi:hypothetical protein QTO34_012360 [Cnephaeus nilssonii]|uniref:Uncharacterized protein n=1 Tax=Cnephaeus nilssonii TaxID=3371016 RepID=A0AA40HBD0_CNENI|nr:hypothetical protein QTO34_012360 [Eptesicus nilssonii]
MVGLPSVEEAEVPTAPPAAPRDEGEEDAAAAAAAAAGVEATQGPVHERLEAEEGGDSLGPGQPARPSLTPTEEAAAPPRRSLSRERQAPRARAEEIAAAPEPGARQRGVPEKPPGAEQKPAGPEKTPGRETRPRAVDTPVVVAERKSVLAKTDVWERRPSPSPAAGAGAPGKQPPPGKAAGAERGRVSERALIFEKAQVSETKRVPKRAVASEQPQAREKPQAKEQPQAREKPRAKEKPQPEDEPRPKEKPQPEDEPRPKEKPQPEDEPRPKEKPQPEDEPRPKEKPQPEDEPRPKEKPQPRMSLGPRRRPRLGSSPWPGEARERGPSAACPQQSRGGAPLRPWPPASRPSRSRTGDPMAGASAGSRERILTQALDFGVPPARKFPQQLCPAAGLQGAVSPIPTAEASPGPPPHGPPLLPAAPWMGWATRGPRGCLGWGLGAAQTACVKIPSKEEEEEEDAFSPTGATYSSSLRRSSPRTISFRVSVPGAAGLSRRARPRGRGSRPRGRGSDARRTERAFGVPLVAPRRGGGVPGGQVGAVVGKRRLASHTRLSGPWSVALPQNATAWASLCGRSGVRRSLSLKNVALQRHSHRRAVDTWLCGLMSLPTTGLGSWKVDMDTHERPHLVVQSGTAGRKLEASTGLMGNGGGRERGVQTGQQVVAGTPKTPTGAQGEAFPRLARWGQVSPGQDGGPSWRFGGELSRGGWEVQGGSV